MSRRKKKSVRKGQAFVGAYVDEPIKVALKAEADQLDRPLNWIIEKILSEGVKHLKQAA